MDKIYCVEGTQILVSWQKILPRGKDALSEKVVLFFPGWAFRADSKTMRRIGEHFANNFANTTYIIYTRSERVIPDSLYQEAKAVCMFLEESHVKEIALVGYSQGGIKAIDTSVLLQERNPDIAIDGLILISSVGLSEIDKGEFAKGVLVDIFITSWPLIIRECTRESSWGKKFLALIENIAVARRAFLDLSLSLLREMRTSKQNYFSRIKNELNEMVKRSFYLDQIQAPILLIQGAKDHISLYERILAQSPTKTTQKILPVNKSEDFSLRGQDRREKTLREHLFARSFSLRMVKAEKFGTHVLLIFRSQSVARASFYLLCTSRLSNRQDSGRCSDNDSRRLSSDGRDILTPPGRSYHLEPDIPIADHV